MRNSWMKSCIMLALILGLAGCETVDGFYGSPIGAPVAGPVSGPGAPAPSGGNFSLITPQQEIELGQQVAAEIERREELHSDAALQAYVQGIGERLAANASRQDVPYTFAVIDDPDTINAFALPGGRMYVYTGLMKVASNEAELAGVMAHEIAHVALRHHASMITRQYGFDLLTGIILGQNPDDRARLVADLVGMGVQARYSRDQEKAADALGMQLLVNAGYNPEAMVQFYDKMFAASQRTPRVPLFASHPPTQERMQTLRALAQTFPADARTANPVYQERYQQQVLERF